MLSALAPGNLIAQTMNYICHKFQLKFMEAMAKITRIGTFTRVVERKKECGLFIFIFAVVAIEISFIE